MLILFSFIFCLWNEYYYYFIAQESYVQWYLCNDICAMIFSKISYFILSLPGIHIWKLLFQDPWPWQVLELDPSNLYPTITCEGSFCVKWIPSIVHRRFVVTYFTIIQEHRGTGYYSENIAIFWVFVYCNILFYSEK